MSKISDYSVVSIPKLADKLIGTSVGGVLNNKTYNFTLQKLQDLFFSNAGIVTVKDFGAVGDGIADDTVAIQEAVTFLSTTGGTLMFPVGTYKVTSEITQTYSSSVNFKMIGYGAIIDGSTSSGTNLFAFLGQRSTSSLLSASPNKMDTSISTTTSIGVVANDFIMLQSTDLWCPARTYYYKGELSQILSTSGTTYNLGSQLFDGYTASTTTAYKLIMPTIEIEGMEFIRNGNKIGINIQYATNVSILNCKIHGARYSALQLFYCYGGLVQNNQIYDCWVSGTGTSYGVTVASCQFVKVANNTISEARHCITTGGDIPSRSHIYIGNSCLMHPSAGQSWAIDTHGNTEFIIIEGNYANGTTISGRSATIIGNTFIGILPASISGIVGTIVITPEGDIDNIEIRNNSVTSNYSSTYASGIVVVTTKADGNYNNIIISNNIIKVIGSAIYFGIGNALHTNNIINNLEISDNHFETNVFYCFIINGNGIIGFTINKLTSNNNHYYSKYSSASITNYNEVKIAYFTNDRFYSGGNGIVNTIFRGLDEAIFTNCRWEGNVTGLGDAGEVYLSGTGKILNYLPITNNISRIDIGTSVTDYLEQGRTGNVLSLYITSTTRYINGYSRFGYAFAYGTSIPTTGTWNQYDEVYNTNNAVGNPLKWVCDVGGTPGTWRAISLAALSLSTIGAVPNANAATLTGTTLNLQPASGSFGGVVTTGTQAFAGAKTFNSDLSVNSLTIGKGGSSISTNTAIGYQVLTLNTTGVGNTALGYATLNNNTTSSYSTAIGYSALYFNTTGTGNTAVGQSALYNITTSSNNVALGNSAGRYITGGATSNTTSSNSVYLGVNTNANADGDTNEIVIGYATTGNGSNTVTIGNASITANYFKGSLAINTSTINASAALQVTSTTKGFLPPVMTTTQKNAIATPATGLVVFDSTLGKLCVFSTTWQTITSI